MINAYCGELSRGGAGEDAVKLSGGMITFTIGCVTAGGSGAELFAGGAIGGAVFALAGSSKPLSASEGGAGGGAAGGAVGCGLGGGAAAAEFVSTLFAGAGDAGDDAGSEFAAVGAGGSPGVAAWRDRAADGGW